MHCTKTKSKSPEERTFHHSVVNILSVVIILFCLKQLNCERKLLKNIHPFFGLLVFPSGRKTKKDAGHGMNDE